MGRDATLQERALFEEYDKVGFCKSSQVDPSCSREDDRRFESKV